MFNPQAVLLYSPSCYETHINVRGKLTSLTAYHQSNGNYSFDSVLPVDFRDQLKVMFTAQGLPGLYRGRQVSTVEALKMMALLDARIDAGAVARQGPAYADFLQTQLDCYKQPAPPAEFVQARANFIRNATELLKAIQKTHFEQFAIRELFNPVQCVALSKQRTGVFIWPDWEDARYINLVLGCTQEDRREIREVVHDWAETMRLRINTGVSF
jgi:hypothetical protein